MNDTEYAKKVELERMASNRAPRVRDATPRATSGEVSHQALRLENSMGTMGELLDELESRLGAVLRGSEPTKIEENEVSEPALTSLGSQLSVIADRLSGACDRVQNITARLEL